ncbi:cytochrome P450 [Flagelloscypha sp. PMI_526]|nr:cytochrome P450 [Flagelloscypha sp. PMI_526]
MAIESTLLLIPVAIAFFLWKQKKSTPGPYPPGPKGHWLLGNLLDFPRSHPWETFTEWKHQYGDLVFLTILGHKYLILNGMDTCTELLQRRHEIYSDRLHLPMLHELVGLKRSIVFMDFADAAFKLNRKLCLSVLNPIAVKHQSELQEASSARILAKMLQSPENHIMHFEHASISTNLRMLYGIKPSSEDIEDRHKAVAVITKSIGNPFTYIVDFLPFLRHFPSFAPWHKQAKLLRDTVEIVMNDAFERTEREIAAGTASQSLVARILDDPELNDKGPGFRDLLKWCAGTMSAGSETIPGVEAAFLWAMILYPEVQIKAQKEIDTVIGSHRLPKLDDREDMPYMTAVIKELMRWYIITPLAGPRSTARDDYYNGYFIPKGTSLFVNTYGIAQTEAGPNPELFRPERYLDGSCTIHPRDFIFGFGRRQCPARSLAENTLFINLSGILACFNIAANKKDVVGPPREATSILSTPGHCPCDITVRSEEARNLILAVGALPGNGIDE